ncbi:MAG: MBL fold metallo-hydrolase [Methylocystaceae bacterium]
MVKAEGIGVSARGRTIEMPGELENKGMIVSYPDCYLVRQPMPYPLATSNSYLVPIDAGWAVIDVGVDLPITRELWQLVLKELGIEWPLIKAIYITHCHPDHLGAAAWLQQMTGAPVYMAEQEIKRARQFIWLPEDYAESYSAAAGAEMLRQGFGSDKSRRLVIDWRDEVRPLYPEPEYLVPLAVNQEIKLFGKAFRVVSLPGHTDGQIGFWSSENQLLFAADLLSVKGGYLHFTDWPNTTSLNPLGDLFDALDLVEQIGARELLPGHGLKIEQPMQAVERLRRRHQQMLGRVAELMTSPHHVAEIYPQIATLADEEYIHYHRVCLGEALGYMRYLEAAGQLHSYLENGIIRFAKA